MSIILDILGSMVIRGAVVLIILSTNVSLHTLLYQKTARTSVTEKLAETIEPLRADIKRAGLNTTSVSFIIADSNQIKFLADVDGNGVADTAYYYLSPTSELSVTDNPNDRKMYRVLNGGQPYDFASGVVQLKFEYFDVISLIRSISVKLFMEYGSAFDGRYPSSYGECHVFPSNV